MSVVINNNTTYAEYIISSVNYSAQLADTQLAEMGLEYHKEKINLVTGNTSLAVMPEMPTFNFVGNIYRQPTCKIERRPLEESLKILKRIHDDIFDGNFIIEVFDKTLKEFVKRPLEYNDVIISGSCAFTIFYDLVNTETGDKFISNDVDVYLLVNAKTIRRSDDSHFFNRIFVNFQIGDMKYQIIKQNSRVKTNVYGFYDFDICRGCIEYIDKDTVLRTMSYRMLEAIKTGICFLGFHTSDVRIAKYSERGLGIVVINGTKIIELKEYYNSTDIKPYTIRGLNAVRAVQCNTCHLMHTNNKENISAFFFNCESCWNKLGVTVVKERFDPSKDDRQNVLWAGPKADHYFVLNHDTNKQKLVHAVRTLKENRGSIKLTVPQINISSLLPNDRRNIIRVLGLSEETFVNGRFYKKQRKHTIRLQSEDPYLKDLSLFIRAAKDSIIYKTCFKFIDEVAVFYCCLYIPKQDITEQIKALIDAITNTTSVIAADKPYMPIITDGRYRSFNHSDKNDNTGFLMSYETTLDVVKGTYGRPKSIPQPTRKFAAKLSWPTAREDLSDDEEDE